MYQLLSKPSYGGRALLYLLKIALDLNVQPGPGGSGMSEIEPARHLYDRWIGEDFPGHWTNCRVVGLWPSQQIPLHVDASPTGTRYHIPLQTNRRCLQFTENAQGVIHCQTLDIGRVYQLDPTLPHGAVNWGEDVRLHLMIDVEA
jgi:hypothetical protein